MFDRSVEFRGGEVEAGRSVDSSESGQMGREFRGGEVEAGRSVERCQS